jgi:hypothetical protein
MLQPFSEFGNCMVIIDCFQERLLHRIDEQIADAEQLLHANQVWASGAGQEPAVQSVDRLHEFLIRMREHRRRVRRSFHFRQQSVTDSLIEALSAAHGAE